MAAFIGVKLMEINIMNSNLFSRYFGEGNGLVWVRVVTLLLV